MTWPREYNLHMIDLSKHQGTPDWNIVKQRNPDIKCIFNRVSVGDYYIDPAFQVNYDGQNNAGFDTGVYFVPHPNTSFVGMKEKFLAGLDGRKPKAIVVDCEKGKNWIMPSKARVIDYTYNTFDWVLREFPNAKILNYTAKWYWQEWIGNVSFTNEFPIIIASYPYVYDSYDGYRQAENFIEIIDALPHLNNFPLLPSYMTNVRGWQFSEKGRISGIDTSSTDLDLFDPVLYNEIWKEQPTQPSFDIDKAIQDISNILEEIRYNYNRE